MSAVNRPKVSVLLAAYAQQDTVMAAVQSALAQTYSPLQIIVSDDASPDATFQRMQQATANYTGQHQLLIRRNERNEGISAHFSRLAALADGELLIVAAGDDVSEPERCAEIVDHWLQLNKTPDLIATDLFDMDQSGTVHGEIRHTPLDACTLDDWLRQRPWLVGASHAWSKRLFDRFGGMRPGAHAEDQIMLLRALLMGGATTLHRPLVRWRRGGLSAKRRHANVQALLEHMRKGNAAGLAEIEQLLADARLGGRFDAVHRALAERLQRETFTRDMLASDSSWQRLRMAVQARDVRSSVRWRLFGYTSLPWIYDPVLRLKSALELTHGRDAAGRPAS